MATLQSRGKRWRAIVRRKGHAPKSKTFPTKTAAKTWAERIDRELAEMDARGEVAVPDLTIAELIDWQTNELGGLKAISKTQAGNMTRLREGMGLIRPGFRRHSRPSLRVAPFKLYRGQVAG
ncbi:hypothetical protein [Xanthomonas oryzae]|uniref:hypothetical protein n=1 Tax=Xanthomonas oryzae TaxID=347 RepID=UPI0018F23650|nr:hypothetical protein [Xanthomonas oryzae]